MSASNSGGPAFPYTLTGQTDICGRSIQDVAFPGMTLRQYYKAAAMQGMLGRLLPNELGNTHINHASTRLMSSTDVARDAARYADAMLAEDAEFASRQSQGGKEP